MYRNMDFYGVCVRFHVLSGGHQLKREEDKLDRCTTTSFSS